MILDYRNNPAGENEQRLSHGRCLVNGKELRLCSFIDTDAGLVRSLDVLGDGHAHLSDGLMGNDSLAAAAGIVLEHGEVAYKTILGRIELFTKDGEQLA